MKGFAFTRGMQGTSGYPPLIILYRGKWTYVEGSSNHGGSICYICSYDNNIPFGHESAKDFEQPRPYGMRCYRSLVVWKTPYKRFFLNKLPTITWEQFVAAIKRERSLPEVIKPKRARK